MSKSIRVVLFWTVVGYASLYVLLLPWGIFADTNRWGMSEIVLLGLLIVATSGLLDSVVELSFGNGGFAAKFETIEEEQADHSRRISCMEIAFRGIVSTHEHRHLVGLNKDESFNCYYSDDLYTELKRLRALGMAIHHEGSGLSYMRNDHKDSPGEYDLKSYFRITDGGRQYLALREELDSQ